MTSFEARLQQAKQLIRYEHTYRFLSQRGVDRASQPTLDLLACIACRQAQGWEASTIEIGAAGCVPEKVTGRLGLRLAALGVLYRSKIHRGSDGKGGKPRFDHQIRMMSPEMRQELMARRPCQRADSEASSQ